MKVKLNWLKRLHRFLLSNYEKRCSNRYYKSIEDLPVYNWWKLHEENDFKYLLRDSNKKVNRYAINIFKSIKDEFVNEFGIDRRYEQYLDKVWKLEMYNIKMALTGDKSDKIFADNLEFEIEDLLNEQETKVHNHGVMHIEKYMGFRLDIKTTTVNEFYGYVKEIEKQVKKQD